MGEADIGERETLRHSPLPGRIGEIVQVGTDGGAFQMGGVGLGWCVFRPPRLQTHRGPWASGHPDCC